MLNMLRKRQENEEGFTLIELMVVVLIIAILLAIAIPTFLSAQDRAKDRAAQSDLRNSLTAAKTLATDQEGFFRKVTAAGPPVVYGVLTFAELNDAETALDHLDTVAAADVDNIGVAVGAVTDVGEDVLLVKESKSSDGLFWGIMATKDGDVTYCKAVAPASITAASCDSASFAAAPTL